MSKIKCNHLFTSESVSEGHPDKVCDQISDAILDACLKQDSESRVACETLVTTDLVVLSGEISTNAKLNIEEIVRNVIREIGYNTPDVGFCAENCKIMICLHSQSEDISQGVTEGKGTYKEQGAGDQGMMFGYASDATAEYMPAPIYYAHKLMENLAKIRHSEAKEYSFLRPDAKSQVTIRYEGGKPIHIENIVVSHQHTPEMEYEQLLKVVKKIVKETIPSELLYEGTKYFINPTGRFVIGGPHGDTGLTGRKIIVDTYGGVGCHGGGAFSGKDPSKVDRSAAYMARYTAKNIVAAGLAKKCEVQASYAIGVAQPLSINVDTYGTGIIADEKLQEIITNSGVFNFLPSAIIKNLELKEPHKNGWCYQDTAVYGHFGRDKFPWERTDKAAELKEIVKGYL